jgi:hypothetical protein
MSKINLKDMVSKVKETINKGVEKYTEYTDKAEAKIMNKCGSDRTIDEVVGESMDRVGYSIKHTTIRTTTLIVEKSKPVCKNVHEHVLAAKDKSMHVINKAKSMVPRKSTPAPMARPVVYTQQHDTPEYVPQCSITPAAMSVGARMNNHAHRGSLGVPMAVCK